MSSFDSGICIYGVSDVLTNENREFGTMNKASMHMSSFSRQASCSVDVHFLHIFVKPGSNLFFIGKSDRICFELLHHLFSLEVFRLGDQTMFIPIYAEVFDHFTYSGISGFSSGRIYESYMFISHIQH